MASIDWIRAIPLFLRDQAELTGNALTAWVTFPEVGAKLNYGGVGCWPLSAAIKGWAYGVLRDQCPHCGTPAWILGVQGGPTRSSSGHRWGVSITWVRRELARLGEWQGVCRLCGPVVKTSPAGPIVFENTLEGRLVPLGHRPILIPRQAYSFDFAHGALRFPDQDEVRLAVPSWRDFIAERYPELLRPGPKKEVEHAND